MVSKVLVGYDGSESARRAFRFGLELAYLYEARLLVLAVAQPPDPAVTIVDIPAFQEERKAHFDKEFAVLRPVAESAGMDLETRLVFGSAADQIVQQATTEGADVIVVGRRGLSVVQRWLAGSVSKQVVSYAPCSVLVVR